MTIYTGYSYRLRAGSPMPISTPGEFVIHSFMAEYHIQDTDTCAIKLLGSSSFRGQGGGYSAANYSRIVSAGEPIYNATESLNFKYVEEV